jgi:nitrite reductase/ring-hydroxylating ferredoxin subunit
MDDSGPPPAMRQAGSFFRRMIVAQRVRIAGRSEVPPGEGRVVTAGDRTLALFNLGDRFHAVDNTCPHRGGPLGEGTLEGTVVTCPWHGWQFDVCSGVSPRNPAATVGWVRVEADGDDLYACLD